MQKIINYFSSILETIKQTFIITFKQIPFFVFIVGAFVLVFNYFSKFLFSKLLVFLVEERGYTEFTLDIAQKLINDPLTLLLLIVVAIITVFITTIPIIFYFDIWLNPDKYISKNIFSITKTFARSYIEILKIKPYFFIIFIVLIFTFSNVYHIPTILEAIDIPKFILYEVDGNDMIWLTKITFYTIIAFLSIKLIFYFCCLITDKDKKVVRKSISLTRKNMIKIIISLMLIWVFMNIFFTGFSFLIDALADYSFNTLKNTQPALSSFFIGLSSFLMQLLINLCDILLAALTVGWVVTLYRKITNTPTLASSSKPSKTTIIICIVTFLLITFLSVSIPKNDTSDTDLEIIAHRGNSYEELENTYRAFDLAIQQKTDVIELDVQLTKDGQVIVYHDENIKKLMGIDKKAIDLTKKDIASLTFSPDYDDLYFKEKIPLLDDVLKKYKNDTVFMIELKPSKDVPNLEKEVVSLIKKYNLTNNVYVKSLKLDSVLKVEEMEPSIKTGYIMSYAIANYVDDYEKLDFFSVEQTSLDFTLIKHFMESDKEVFVWTINTKDELMEALEYEIDGIITDQPLEMRRYLDYIKVKGS